MLLYQRKFIRKANEGTLVKDKNGGFPLVIYTDSKVHVLHRASGADLSSSFLFLQTLKAILKPEDSRPHQPQRETWTEFFIPVFGSVLNSYLQSELVVGNSFIFFSLCF